jgi:hypothetical protein
MPGCLRYGMLTRLPDCRFSWDWFCRVEWDDQIVLQPFLRLLDSFLESISRRPRETALTALPSGIFGTTI